MIFKKICIIDSCRLTDSAIDRMSKLSEQAIERYTDFPQTDDEIIKRMAGSDCVLVSWGTKINADVLKASPELKFIGMCCSLYDAKSDNVDIDAASQLGIVVKGVRDYGDDGTVEFVFAELICLFKGLQKYQWRSEACELKNKSIGIIGFGTLGQLVARTAVHFGMQVSYFSRTRKNQLENENIHYLPLEDLLRTCDIVTTHLPKNTVLLSEKEFKIKKKNSILVNTSLGLSCDKQALLNWLAEDESSFAIFDSDGTGTHKEELRNTDRVIISEQSAGFTFEAKERLSEKVLQYLTDYLVKN